MQTLFPVKSDKSFAWQFHKNAVRLYYSMPLLMCPHVQIFLISMRLGRNNTGSSSYVAGLVSQVLVVCSFQFCLDRSPLYKYLQTIYFFLYPLLLHVLLQVTDYISLRSSVVSFISSSCVTLQLLQMTLWRLFLAANIMRCILRNLIGVSCLLCLLVPFTM